MTDDRAKTPRTLMVADHIWEAFSAMAAEMGSDRDALVNQALYTFARLNGFLLPADLKRLRASQPPQHQSSSPRPASQRRPVSAPPVPGDSEPPPVALEDALHDDDGQDTSMALPATETGAVPPAGRTLILLADGRELDRVVKDRFLIGRGKHCDLIINSGKVSREHAAITRQNGTWFIEDLGSSNGTWFDKRRISRRQIQEGDEYFICSEKLGCTFR